MGIEPTERARERPGTPPPPDDLRGPDIPDRHRRLDWSALLARVHGPEVLLCPTCRQPLCVIAFITAPQVVRMILTHLGLPWRPPSRAPPAFDGEQVVLADLPADRLDGVDPPWTTD